MARDFVKFVLLILVTFSILFSAFLLFVSLETKYQSGYQIENQLGDIPSINKQVNAYPTRNKHYVTEEPKTEEPVVTEEPIATEAPVKPPGPVAGPNTNGERESDELAKRQTENASNAAKPSSASESAPPSTEEVPSTEEAPKGSEPETLIAEDATVNNPGVNNPTTGKINNIIIIITIVLLTIVVVSLFLLGVKKG